MLFVYGLIVGFIVGFIVAGLCHAAREKGKTSDSGKAVA